MEINSLDALGKSMSSQEIASFLGVSPATVCSVAGEFGGIRVGDEYVFFENVFLDRLKRKFLQEHESRTIALPRIDEVDAVHEPPQQLEDRHGIFG